jgi:Ca2+-binding RTX toxin-like protein
VEAFRHRIRFLVVLGACVAAVLTAGGAVSAQEPNYISGTPGDDTLYGTDGVDRMDGLEGSDVLYGDDANDELYGGDGPGDDVLYGNAGDDHLFGDAGKDRMSGGVGRDTVSFPREFGSPASQTVYVSLDNRPNDGPEGFGDNVHTDVEDVVMMNTSRAVVTGSAAENLIDTGMSDDAVDGGAGADVLVTGDGDDKIRATDGEIDTVWCGPGVDSVHADPEDVVNHCENVSTPTTVTGGEVPPPQPPRPRKRRRTERPALSDFKVSYRINHDRLRLLGVDGLTRGVTVRAFCASGCGKGKRALAKKRSHGKTVRLRVSAKHNVGVGDQIEVHVTKAKHVGRYAVLRFIDSFPGIKRLRSGCLAGGKRVEC